MDDYEKNLKELKFSEQQTIEKFSRLREDGDMKYESDGQYYPEVWGHTDWINTLVSPIPIILIICSMTAVLVMGAIWLQAR